MSKISLDKNLSENQKSSVKSLVYTSDDDCKSSLFHVTDTEVLNEALRVCRELGFRTKVTHIERRIRALAKNK